MWECESDLVLPGPAQPHPKGIPLLLQLATAPWWHQHKQTAGRAGVSLPCAVLEQQPLQPPLASQHGCTTCYQTAVGTPYPREPAARTASCWDMLCTGTFMSISDQPVARPTIDTSVQPMPGTGETTCQHNAHFIQFLHAPASNCAALLPYPGPAGMGHAPGPSKAGWRLASKPFSRWVPLAAHRVSALLEQPAASMHHRQHQAPSIPPLNMGNLPGCNQLSLAAAAGAHPAATAKQVPTQVWLQPAVPAAAACAPCSNCKAHTTLLYCPPGALAAK